MQAQSCRCRLSECRWAERCAERCRSPTASRVVQPDTQPDTGDRWGFCSCLADRYRVIQGRVSTNKSASHCWGTDVARQRNVWKPANPTATCECKGGHEVWARCAACRRAIISAGEPQHRGPSQSILERTF